jgi:hypothetical protein
MSEAQKDHFKTLVYALLQCYAEDKQAAVIVLGDLTDETASVVTVNCNEMDAATLLLAADNFFNYINMREAPPKEAMN